MNKLFDKQIPLVEENDIAIKSHFYPFLQTLNSSVKPSVPIDIKKHKLKILVYNLDGGVTTKLQNNHPIINRIIKTHYPHIMAFLDVRHSSLPKIDIPGYSLVTYAPGDPKTYHHVGGILVYKRNDVMTKISVEYKSDVADLIVLKNTATERVNTYLLIGYCRPYKASNMYIIRPFWSEMNKQIEHIRNTDSGANIIISGDLNAKLGVLTHDKHTSYNYNGNSLRSLINTFNLRLANVKYQPGVPTFYMHGKAKSSSIIDMTLSNKLYRNISNFQIDHSRVFKTHKQIITTLNTSDICINDMDPIYAIGSRVTKNKEILKDVENLQTKHHSLILKYILNTEEYKGCNGKQLSHFVTIFSYYSMIKCLINSNGLYRANSHDAWINANLEIQSLNDQMILHMNDPDKIEELTSLYNAKRNELIEKKINENSESIVTQKKHHAEKYLKKLFVQNDQKTTIQNLMYEGKNVPTDDALYHFYKN